MSRKLQSKNKDLVNLQVVSADKVWHKDKKTGKQKIRKDLNIYGRVEKGYTGYITSTNQSGKNHKFVENFSSLSKVTKNEVVNKFNNENKRVVYLIKKKGVKNYEKNDKV